MKKQRFRRNKAGVTLTETLVTVMILSLLAAALISGSQAAMGVYRDSVFVSDSANVSDTLRTALADVLRYADGVETAEGAVRFRSTAYGIPAGEGRLTLCVGRIYLTEDTGDTGLRLLSDEAYAAMFVVPADCTTAASAHAYLTSAVSDADPMILEYGDGVFRGSYRLYDPYTERITEEQTFTFRRMSEN